MKKLILGFIVIGLFTFLVGCELQKGCTDPKAINFDSAAEENDGSCVYPDSIFITDTIYYTDTLHTGCKIDTLSKKIEVVCPLNSNAAERRLLGYWLDEAQFAAESSKWERLFMVAVFDKKTLKPWHSQKHGDFGHLNYGNHIEGWNGYNFYFKNNNSAGLQDLISFVNHIPDSSYVLFYSFRGNHCQNWLTGSPISNQYETMYTEIGANVDSLKNYPNKWPYILLFKKGDPNTVEEGFYYEGINSLECLILKATMRNY